MVLLVIKTYKCQLPRYLEPSVTMSFLSIKLTSSSVPMVYVLRESATELPSKLFALDLPIKEGDWNHGSLGLLTFANTNHFMSPSSTM